MADKLKPCPFCGEVHTVERIDALRAELVKFAKPENWRVKMGDVIWIYKDEPWGMAQAALDAAGGTHE